MKINECVQGEKWHDYGEYKGHPIKGHRHDQSILSILRSRFCTPVQELSVYGEWRSYSHAKESNAVIYVHRRSYSNLDGLKVKPS